MSDLKNSILKSMERMKKKQEIMDKAQNRPIRIKSATQKIADIQKSMVKLRQKASEEQFSRLSTFLGTDLPYKQVSDNYGKILNVRSLAENIIDTAEKKIQILAFKMTVEEVKNSVAIQDIEITQDAIAAFEEFRGFCGGEIMANMEATGEVNLASFKKKWDELMTDEYVKILTRNANFYKSIEIISEEILKKIENNVYSDEGGASSEFIKRIEEIVSPYGITL